MLADANAALRAFQANPSQASSLAATYNEGTNLSATQSVVAPLTVTPATFGISDQWLEDYVCSPSAPLPVSAANCGGGHVQTAFAQLMASPTIGGLVDARMFTPYDTLMSYNPTSNSCAWVNNVSSWNGLESFLIAAKAEGLMPTIALAIGNNSTGSQITGTYHTDPTVPLVLQSTSDADSYLCGVEAIMQITSASSLPVTQWEAFNEPDDGQNQATTDLKTNADNAAGMLVDMESESAWLGRSTDTFAAGAFNHYRVDWDDEYRNELQSFGVYPAVWSIHDYADPTSSTTSCTSIGAGGCSANTIDYFRNDINAFYSANSRIQPVYWITETGPQLNAGGALNYNASNLLPQAEAAEDVLTLAHHSNQVTRVFEYNLQTTPFGPSTFDSALIDTDGSSPQDGNWQTPNGSSLLRPSYCVLVYGDSPSTAANTALCQDPGGNLK